MKIKSVYVTLAIWLAGMFSGEALAASDNKTIQVNPSPLILTGDSLNQAHLALTVKVPAHYFKKRNRLVITPQLVCNDSVLDEYMPMVVDAPIYNKKLNRKIALEGYVDSFTGTAVKLDKTNRAFDLTYDEVIEIPSSIDNARIRGIVSRDGCGECTGMDTIPLAAISNPVSLMPKVKETLKLEWIEPEFVIRPKIMTARGTAHLQFVMNKYDINSKLGNNAHEIGTMVDRLKVVLSDSLATLNSLSIYGMASADGSLPFNTVLSRNRANSAKNYLVRELGLNQNIQRMIETGSRPEGWKPVLDAMTADGNPDSVQVKNILEKYADKNDDVQEYYIRRLPCWSVVRQKYLQKDRKVVYEYTYTIKSFTTDAELLEMYGKRLDAFNEDEMLRVASLAKDDASRMQVYQTILKYFPQSKVAANNLAVLYLRQDNEEAARKVLEQLNEYSEETLNTLAATYIYEENYERAIELLQQVDLPITRYNLGLLKAHQRKLKEAYVLLRPFADVNSAICALSVNENNEADTILKGIKDELPLTEYVRALVNARLNKNEKFYMHLEHFCHDAYLKKRAMKEPDFEKFQSDYRFRNLLGLVE